MKQLRLVAMTALMLGLFGGLALAQNFDVNQISIKSVDAVYFRLNAQKAYEYDMAVTFTNAGAGLQFRDGAYQISIKGVLGDDLEDHGNRDVVLDFSTIKLLKPRDILDFKASGETQYIFQNIPIGLNTEATIRKMMQIVNLMANPDHHKDLEITIQAKGANVWVPAKNGWVLSPIGKGFEADLVFKPELPNTVLLK